MNCLIFWPVYTSIVVVSLLCILHNGANTPGALTQCDMNVPNTERFVNYDNSWLCYEDGAGWPFAHIVNPLALTLITGKPAWVAATYFIFEVFEIVAVINLKTFVFVPADPLNYETLPGSILADAALQGTYGLLIGVSLAEFVGWHGFIRYWKRMSRGVLTKYILLLFVSSLTFIPTSASTSSYNYGPSITLVLQSLLILVVIPWAIGVDDVMGIDFRREYRKVKLLWWLVIIPLAVTALVPRFLVNYYYPLWIIANVQILLFQGLAFVRRYNQTGDFGPKKFDSNQRLEVRRTSPQYIKI
jgi:hypothetical protein